jgi:hypothetical protein
MLGVLGGLLTARLYAEYADIQLPRNINAQQSRREVYILRERIVYRVSMLTVPISCASGVAIGYLLWRVKGKAPNK